MADPIRTNPALSPPGVTSPAIPAASAAPAVAGPSFDDLLRSRIGAAGPLRFSGHALDRLARRNITVDPTTMQRLTDGVGRAAAKGSRQSLVLVEGTAFVVSVPNRTVITAVGPDTMRERVFTNIDSAVIG